MTDERLRIVEGDIREIKATMVHLATKDDVQEMRVELIKWVIGTSLATAGVAATLASILVRMLLS